MSVELVNQELSAFLQGIAPQVVCVRGKWGVGKTYTWNAQLKAAQTANQLKLPRYSYVSLFGLNSLAELKFSIFENVVPIASGKLRADVATVDELINTHLGSWRRLTKIAQSVPIVKSFIGTEAPGVLSFLSIRDQIVCLDDLERRGKGLAIGDVLGLISFLREQRNCKVAILLNDEELPADEKADFERYLEKVVDTSLVYEPSATDAVSVAKKFVDPITGRTAELCEALGVSNIRVIRRIDHFIRLVKPIVQEFDPDVFKQASSSIALFVWSYFQPGEAPSLQFLTKRRLMGLYGPKKDEVVPPHEAAWNALLEDYGYSRTDELDLILLQGIKNGYFDQDQIKAKAKELHDNFTASKASGSFEDAWRKFHDSFSDNQTEVLDTIYHSFMKNFNFVTPMNLNGTVRLFKELGDINRAKAMIEHYVQNRKVERKFFDLDEYPFAGDVDDPDVIAAFKAKYDSMEEKRDLVEMILVLKDDWSDDVVIELAAIPVEKYYAVFKANEGERLRKILSAVFQFDRVVNANQHMREISKRAREALSKIGAESKINAHRVARFGVNAGAPNQESGTNPA
jgi:hypothetical protein